MLFILHDLKKSQRFPVFFEKVHKLAYINQVNQGILDRKIMFSSMILVRSTLKQYYNFKKNIAN